MSPRQFQQSSQHLETCRVSRSLKMDFMISGFTALPKQKIKIGQTKRSAKNFFNLRHYVSAVQNSLENNAKAQKKSLLTLTLLILATS